MREREIDSSVKLPFNLFCIKRHYYSPKKRAANFLRSLRLAETFCSVDSTEIRLVSAGMFFDSAFAASASAPRSTWVWLNEASLLLCWRLVVLHQLGGGEFKPPKPSLDPPGPCYCKIAELHVLFDFWFVILSVRCHCGNKYRSMVRCSIRFAFEFVAFLLPNAFFL